MSCEELIHRKAIFRRMTMSADPLCKVARGHARTAGKPNGGPATAYRLRIGACVFLCFQGDPIMAAAPTSNRNLTSPAGIDPWTTRDLLIVGVGFPLFVGAMFFMFFVGLGNGN
jgi:hypothetical protein